jgi:hypothetical protein
MASTVLTIFEFRPMIAAEIRSKVEIVAIRSCFKPTFGT